MSPQKLQVASRLIITTGDEDGIGPEVAVKALLSIGPQKKFHFVIFKSSRDRSALWKKLASKFRLQSYTSWAHFLSYSHVNTEAKDISLIESHLEAPRWVELAAHACLHKEAQGMITGPLSKLTIRKSGLSDIGHTEILARVSGQSDLMMGFVGSEFSMVLATGHIPLEKVAKSLTSELIFLALQRGKDLALYNRANKKKRTATTLRPTKRQLKRPTVAVLGLNPHSGESGLLGTEESRIFEPVLNKLRSQSPEVEWLGPIPADSAFVKGNRRGIDCFVSAYHDQGLIPFKTIHGFDEGLHITLGLPFLRCSVDHGTGKDIFGKNKANPASMIEALRYCMEASRDSRQ